MVKKEIAVKLEDGLNPQNAAKITQAASGYRSQISIATQGKQVNAKSLMGVMTLLQYACKSVILIATGSDEAEALSALEEILQGG